MFLVLEVIGSNAAALGSASRAVFTAKGGTIGRRAGNDWVLADPHVSGRHARVRSVGGTYFLEDAESANGVLVNGTKIHQGEPFPLKEGDSIFIDPFEISVRMTATMPGAVTEMHPAATPVAPPMAPAAPTPMGSFGPASLPSVDDLLGTQAVAAASPMPEVLPQGAGGLDDLLGMGSGGIPADFNPLLDAPPVRPAAAQPPTGRDLYGKPVINDAMEIRIPPAPSPAQSGGSAIPTNWDAVDVPVTVEPRVPPPTPPRPQAPAPTPVHVAPAQAPFESASPASNSTRPPASPATASSDLATLLRGAGLSEEAISPEVTAQLGQVLRVVVEGLMEVLRARGEIKNEFRLQQTTFKPRENNPLKFSANVEDALHNLLVKRNEAYLDTPSAFEDAFADVRSHQLAMLAGMRAAFDFMLGRFSPEALRTQFDAKPGRKVSLGFSSGGRYWENFEEYYKEMTKDADDCFRRLFGDQFARSYEEQLKRLLVLKGRE
jgi:type VI secretion system FHA domain protein